MISLKRTDANNPDFKELVPMLNADLAARDGEDHPLAKFNSIADIKHVLVAYQGKVAVGCGAMARYDDTTMEVKRMFVIPKQRGQRIAGRILAELESWAMSMNCGKCILFMGSRQPEAEKLYRRNGYKLIEQYGPLRDIPDSRCFMKILG